MLFQSGKNNLKSLTSFLPSDYTIRFMLTGVIVAETFEDMFPNHERTISVELGYTICLTFFSDFWTSCIKPKLHEMDEEEATVHELFFINDCTGFGGSAKWNESIRRITKIPKNEQRKGIQLTEQEVFLCSIEFFKIFDEMVFHHQVKYASNLLMSMQAKPQQYLFEWSIWKKAFDYCSSVSSRYHFNWNAEFRKEK